MIQKQCFYVGNTVFCKNKEIWSEFQQFLKRCVSWCSVRAQYECRIYVHCSRSPRLTAVRSTIPTKILCIIIDGYHVLAHTAKQSEPNSCGETAARVNMHLQILNADN